MMDALNMPDLTALFLVTTFGLATAFVWMFYELERHAARRRPRPLAVPRWPDEIDRP